MSLLDAAGVVTGDIWCSGAFSFESPLKDLLDSGEYTLEQLLGEDELLQELRGVHPQLIEFFSTEAAVTGLVQYVTLPRNGTPPKSLAKVTKEDSGEENENEVKHTAEESQHENATDTQQDEQSKKDALYVRYPYMACEVICCEIKGIIDTLVDGFVPSDEAAQDIVSSEAEQSAEVTLRDPRPQTILDLLFSMLYDSKAGEIDDYRAGYFDKILSVLFRKRPQAMGQYISEGGGKGNEALMRAMFRHLYSHSIMQIVQRLLLPQTPIPTKEEEKEGEEIYSDPLEGADIDGLGSFRCNWSESDTALALLLDCLIEKSPHPEIEDEEERRLSLYQNASEILITIIQNSPLTSPTLHALTTDPTLDKLIKSATCLEEGVSFGPHDSRLTCTMNVLESLILQLGGYGSVGTVMYPEDEQGEGENEEGEEENSESIEVKEGQSPSQTGIRQDLATSDTLISHLPRMLSSLSKLLLYPEAESWVSPMQFAKHEPQRILGSSRLRIVRLLESLVLLGDPNVDSYLCGSDCLEICLDLFWKFQWCSMLHQSVANLLVHVFEGANARSELQSYFLVKCNLLGRLMDSFWDGGQEGMIPGPVDSDGRLSDALMAIKSENSKPPTSSVTSERGSVNSSDVIPVSDEDVDVHLEHEQMEKTTGGQENDADSTKEEGPGEVGTQLTSDHAPSQSFRLGYMGHVIIICQALVHACTNDGGRSEAPSVGGTSSEMNGELSQFVAKQNEEDQNENPEDGALRDGIERGRAADSVITDETPSNPLILAQLVETHALRNRWHDFVTTTLASETAIQSTPLGGFPGSGGSMDPLRSRRPGLAEDDEYGDDDGAAPPLPPRGLLVGGDVIDMDDNDLDVAASMMAGLSLGRGAGGGQPSDQDLLAGIPPQPSGPPSTGGYMFDDPLGDGRFGRFDGDDEDSSDEESELSGNTGDSGGAVADGINPHDTVGEDADAPVMNLYAGNIEAFDDNQDSNGQQEVGSWSDFANFDNAFQGAESGPGQDAFAGSAPGENGGVDDIFGHVKDHANLLEELDDPESNAKEEFGRGEAVVGKLTPLEDDDSSSDEEPVTEQEDAEES